ncbi:MAG: hypothetical protein AVDCRST_MAG28-3506 [uncultured Rubrobacteraceae bacterium]|uniref:Uncharacterized protein n=1 Tax=uncultured Rubrobacteraceae bacterium TaxID=349277 RepID=A0A6J4R2J8_9ACTN|nr:MAG: hypothetical protein AVDCRST_MAG28-3506 [uncultured Rubrobacteraceae bacterium]
MGISAALDLLVGALCDAKGSQRVFLFGAVAGVAGLLSGNYSLGARRRWTLLLGPVMVCMFYEPTYVARSNRGSMGRRAGS